MTDIFGPEGDEIAHLLKAVLALPLREGPQKKGRRTGSREQYLAAFDVCDSCHELLWQIIDLPSIERDGHTQSYRVLCTRQIEFGRNPTNRVRLDRRWSFAIVTGNAPSPAEVTSVACKCGWTDLYLAEILSRVSATEER